MPTFNGTYFMLRPCFLSTGCSRAIKHSQDNAEEGQSNWKLRTPTPHNTSPPPHHNGHHYTPPPHRLFKRRNRNLDFNSTHKSDVAGTSIFKGAYTWTKSIDMQRVRVQRVRQVDSQARVDGVWSRPVGSRDFCRCLGLLFAVGHLGYI